MTTSNSELSKIQIKKPLLFIVVIKIKHIKNNT